MHSVWSFVNASQLVTSNLTSIPCFWVEEERGCVCVWGSSCFLPAILSPLTIIGKTKPKVAQRAANPFTVCDRKQTLGHGLLRELFHLGAGIQT